VLDAVAELAQNGFGDIERVLRHEVDADALGPDERTTCSIFSSSAFGASVNSRCASSKKNTSFGLSGSPTSAGFRTALPASRAGRSRRASATASACRSQDVDHAPASGPGLHQVVQVEDRLPEEDAAPCSSMASRPRWMAPMLAAEMFPYPVLKSAALSPANCAIALRSLRSRSRRPLSSAILKMSVSTPLWTSFRSRMREKRRDPSRRPSS